MMNCSLWMFLPLMFSLMTVVGLWFVYFIAVENENITLLSSEYKSGQSKPPPYISLAGNVPPASCIFSQVMNMSAFAGFILGVLRYQQLKAGAHKPWLNTGSLVALSLACFGMTLVGNFQLGNAENEHNIGTFMTFGLGTLFCWIQSFMTLKVNLRNEGKPAGIARFLLSGAITFCMMLYFALMAQQLHMHAARAQWALVMFFLTYLSTFAIEFRHYHFQILCSGNRDPPLRMSESFSDVSEYQSNQL